MTDTDLQLLKRYARDHAEDAFAEIVRRHLALVYSAALRQVRLPQLAEEVAQSTFTDLARNAGRLKPDTILTAWLYQVTRRTAIDAVRREARRQLREQIATEMNAMNATADDWTYIEPLLDDAMAALDETDRAAVLLRYFENKSLREVGATLGASDDAAQKRVSRAVERLREFFAKRGITVGASGLVVVISANAVQAAPVGLAVTISAAVTLAGTTIATTATATAIKTITMTTLQKAIITTAFAIAVGAGIYEAKQSADTRAEVRTLRQQQAPLIEQIQQLQTERDEAALQLAVLRDENERLNRNTGELLRLRGEVGALRRAQGATAKQAEAIATTAAATMDEDQMAVDAGREFGLAVVRGEAGALEKLAELAKTAVKTFNPNYVKMDDTKRSQVARKALAPVKAAFKEIEEAAVNGNQVAIAAVERALLMPDLKGSAAKIVGTLAAQGNEAALEMLINPGQNNILLSSSVSDLRPVAEAGNQKAIDFLATVAKDEKHQGLWILVVNSLVTPAESGNAVAVDGLVAMSVTTNQYVRDAVIVALKRAAANQNAKALETLRSMGAQRSLIIP